MIVKMEPMAGIEPAILPYKGSVIPFNYIGMLVGEAGIEPT